MALLLYLCTCMWGLQEDFLLALLPLNRTFCSCGLFVFRYLLPCVLANKFSEVLPPPGVSVGSLLPVKEGKSTEYLFLSCTGRTFTGHPWTVRVLLRPGDWGQRCGRGSESHLWRCARKGFSRVTPEEPLVTVWASSLISGVRRS